MSAAPSMIELQRIADQLIAGAELTLEERRAAADSLLQQLTLPRSRYAERNALIVECQRAFFADRDDRDAAREIEIGLNRYRASSWRRDQDEASCPERLRGTVKGAYWAILKSVPSERGLAAETIRKILSRSTR